MNCYLEYLSLANVYHDNKQISKSDLIDLIVDDEGLVENVSTEKDSELSLHEINKLLSTNRDHVMLNKSVFKYLLR